MSDYNFYNYYSAFSTTSPHFYLIRRLVIDKKATKAKPAKKKKGEAAAPPAPKVYKRPPLARGFRTKDLNLIYDYALLTK